MVLRVAVLAINTLGRGVCAVGIDTLDTVTIHVDIGAGL